MKRVHRSALSGVDSMRHMTAAEHVRVVHSVVAHPESSINEISPEIGSSWRRCLLDYHLDPGRRTEPVIVAESDLQRRKEELSLLTSASKSEMIGLMQQVSGSGYAILLSDLEGVILNYVGEPQFTDAAMRSGLRKGAIWSEAAQGTNGIGTCIAEQKPLVIHQYEHFLSHHGTLTCAAAPIRDACGKLIAVLDASSEACVAQHHTMALVSMSAQMIENRMFLAVFNEHWDIRFHSRPEIVSILGEGAVAVDESGVVLGANRSAAFQLDRTHEELIGSSVETVFSESLPRLMDMAKKQAHTLPLHSARDGRRFFGIVQRPASATNGGHSRVLPHQVRDEPGYVDFGMGGSDVLERLHLGDPAIARNIRRARKLVSRNIPLLLYGETGTGKGLFARAFHDAGPRNRNSFVAVNCASIPETLIESELFGYKPGAFTGANRRGSRGKILQADGGTLCLDELGDMPLHLQARLLRVLEEKEVVPLGGEAPETVDVAVISATHRDLTKLIADGQFREDLYYRLHGMALTMPPLRERQDLRALVRDIVERESLEDAPFEVTEEALGLLLQYDWPGNIRQLCNTLRAVLALCEDAVIRSDDLPDEIRGQADEGYPQTIHVAHGEGNEDPLAKAERRAIQQELEAMRGNVSKVARKLQLSRNTLYRKMRQHGVKVPR